MFRESYCSSSGGDLYKQLIAFFLKIRAISLFAVIMWLFITVNDTTCIQSAKLKTWQHVSATTVHQQANNETKSWSIQ